MYSALNQTLREIEILVVDDHSTDMSVAIVTRFAKQDPRIRLVQHDTNVGTHLARVTAVHHAQGSFILSLDPDDRLIPSIAETAFRLAILNGADIVEFQAIEYHIATGHSEMFSFLPPTQTLINGSNLAQLFVNRGLNWNIWKRLIRRETYLKALELIKDREIDRKVVYGEDKLHIGLIFLVAERMFYLREVGYVYYRDISENSESGPTDKMMLSMSQLRYVERLLKTLYRRHRHLSYSVDRGIPAGFRSRIEPELYSNLTSLLAPKEKPQRRRSRRTSRAHNPLE
jgi:glycosyltransferase involved in cell wall biosynthesis